MRKHSISRRQMLKAAAAAAPYVITSTALGNADTPPASERITLGYIGVGGRGRSLLTEFLRCRGAQSVAAADPYKSRREAAARMMEGLAYEDPRELAARDDIDAVVIATPDHWHVPAANMALRSGKDVYVEKPLGLTVEENLEIRKLVRQHNRVFQYGTQQRSMGHCRAACEIVRAGKIGKIRSLHVDAPNGGAGGSVQETPVPEDLNYDLWLGPAPVRPYTVDRCKTPGTYWIYDYSIGYLAGWGAHPLDLLVWACDCDLAGPMTFEGTGVIPEQGLYDTVYNWDVKIEMADGVTMTFKPGQDLTRFTGDEGTVAVSRSAALTASSPESLLKVPLADDQRLPVSPGHAQNFVDCVKSRRTPVSNIDDAVRSDNISQLCDIAIRTGRKITWDPKREVIVGDDEAAKMLSRPLRAPWTL